MQVRALRSMLAGAAAMAVLGGCSDSSPASSILKESGERPFRATVAVSFNNLPDLGTSGQYELWLEAPGQVPVSAGVFRINAQGRPTAIDGTPFKLTAGSATFSPGPELKDITRAYLSMETFNDGDPQRNGPILMSGGIFSDAGFLAVSGEIPTQFAGTPNLSLDQSGAFFILLSPSDNSTKPNNDNQGLHFISAGLKDGLAALFAPVPNAPNMELTRLPDTFVYEAWVVEDVNGRLAATRGTDRSQARFLSVGRFTDPSGNTFDSDGIGLAAGSDPLPLAALAKGWVGSDFVVQGPAGQGEDLTNGRFYAVISIEPVNDPSPSTPFQVLLYQRIGKNAGTGAGNRYSMSNAYNVGTDVFAPAQVSIKLLP